MKYVVYFDQQVKATFKAIVELEGELDYDKIEEMIGTDNCLSCELWDINEPDCEFEITKVTSIKNE